MTDLSAQAREAARLWGAVAPPEPVVVRENAVFRLTLPDGPAALRLHRDGYRSAEAVRSELWLMAALADAGLRVPAPVVPASGDGVAVLPGGRLASVVRWLDGAPLADLPGPEALERIGATLSEFHRISDGLALPVRFERPRWDRAGLLGAQALWGDARLHPALTPAEAARMAEVVGALDAALSGAEARGTDFGLIHADALRENVLFDARGTPALIDFDDCGFGHRLYDLATALFQGLGQPDQPERAAAALQGYCRGRNPGPDAVRRLGLFLLCRAVASVGWTIGRLPDTHPKHRLYLRNALDLADSLL